MKKYFTLGFFFYRFFLSALVTLWASAAMGQSPQNFTVNQDADAITTTVDRLGRGINYSTSGYYRLHFGRPGSGQTAKVPVLVDFQYNPGGGSTYLTYKAMPKTVSTPYTRVVINRVIPNGSPNAEINNPNRFSGFFENTNLSGNVSGTGTEASPINVYFRAEYVETLEDLINSYVINRGVDNIFGNRSDQNTHNNVERVDLILDEGVEVPYGIPLGYIGILLMERAGNDSYKVAAITGLNPDGTVASLRPLVSRMSSGFGGTAYPANTTVFQNSNDPAGDQDIRPHQNLGSQTVSGDFITLQALGVSPGDMLYGISVFPADVNDGHDLIGLTDVPTDTDGNSANGGLDFMGGGGWFFADHLVSASVNGRVYHDQDALHNGQIDGTGIGVVGSQSLYAYFVQDSDNTVLARTIVAPDGSFDFPVVFLEQATGYSVLISTVETGGTTAPIAADLPAGWIATGDGYGIGNQAGTGIEPGSPDLSIPLSFDPDSPHITDIRFGVQQGADLDIEKQVDKPTPYVGEVVTFTIIATNGGAGDADSVTITDLVPSGYQIGTVNEGGVDDGAGTITWFIPLLVSGDSATVSFTALVLETGAYENRATIESSVTHDPDTSNNEDTVSVSVCAAGGDQVPLLNNRISNQ